MEKNKENKKKDSCDNGTINYEEIFCAMSNPELRNKVYKKPKVDIYDEKSIQTILDDFFEDGEVEVRDL